MRTEADTEVLAYSEGAVVPCSVTAHMTLAEVTSELVKVGRRAAESKNKNHKSQLGFPGFVLVTNATFDSAVFLWLYFFPRCYRPKVPSGSTDCALPVTWATEKGRAADVFVVLTNNPLWPFSASPAETLQKHRRVCPSIHVWF